jgi:hypothetical protein
VIGTVFRIALTTEDIKSTPFGSPTGYHDGLGLVNRKVNKFTDISNGISREEAETWQVQE